MGKRLLVFLLALTICMAASTVVLADDVDVLRIAVNGETIEMPAKVIDGELFLPLRAISEKLGFEVLWSGKNQEIIIRMPERNINIRLSDYIIAVDDHESYIQGGYTHVGGRTYMRQDFFSDNMGLKIIWDKAKNDVRIHSVKENPIVINTKKEVKETQTLKLTIQYPEIKGLDNTEVQHKLNSLFSKLAAEAKKEGYEFAKYIGQDEIARGIKVETYFNYQVKYNQNGILSIVFSAYLYSGGAHGNTLQSSYTFDLNTGEECDLKDLFKDGIDYVSYISDEVKKQMEEKGMTDALLNPFDAIKADQDFYLSNNAVVVYFQAYEYFPYVFGIPEFSIPLSTLNDMLKPEFSFLTAIPLKFGKDGYEQKISTEIKGHIGDMVDSVYVDGGSAYIYEKADDNEYLHMGFAGKEYYDLGAIADKNSIADDLVCTEALDLFDKTMVKFQGAFSGYETKTEYFIIEQGIPKPFLSVDGITAEMDIDGDGVKEIITQLPGTITTACIFEWDGNTLMSANVDQALNASFVLFNKEDGSFSAYYRTGDMTDHKRVEYRYTRYGMELKKSLRDMDGIVSENTLDYDKDSKDEKIVVRMVDGKQYEETEAGPFQGWNWQGKFVVSLIDEAGKTISELDLNEAFGGQDLVFNSSFLLQFDDYNNDGNLDFALGQYASSNGNVYRLFTIKDDVIELLPVKTGEIFSSGGRSRYTTEFEKFAKSGFINTYYDNIKGKYIEQHFVWDGSQFIIKSTFEKDVAVSAH